MPKVQILSEEIISKIAAGEVIERPASVVKELMENSIDAGATHISLQLKDAGKTLIHLKDNGEGVGKEDLETIFHRHATSKIKSSDDLFNILSLGFRGEALYSIAAISDITLRSRTKDQDSGWEIQMRGGNKIDIKPCSFPDTGTEIEIRALFYNTPPRKKFLKANTTEMHQIMNIFTPYTMLFPNIHFSLKHQERNILNLKPQKTKAERFAEVLNLEKDHLISVDQNLERTNQDCHVELILGDINLKRTRRDMQFFFINDRPVFSKNISYHMNQIYRLILPPDQFPIFMVKLNVNPEDVDVNIHPTKREVKIQNENTLCSALRSICEEALMSRGQTQKASWDQNLSESDQNASNRSPAARALRYDAHKEPFETAGNNSLFESTPEYQSRPSTSQKFSYPSQHSSSRVNDPSNFYLPKQDFFKTDDESLQSKFKDARYIGVFMKKFLIFESGTSLLLVDQHAAQERIMYELFIEQIQKGNVEIQHLLSPLIMPLSTQDMLLWEENKDKLAELGYESTALDKESIAIHSHPALIKNIEESIHKLLAGENIAACNHETIARRACRASIMTGDKLAPEQVEHQRKQLLDCLDPFTCPHGRPIIIEMDENFLDKQFLRS